MVNTGSEQGKKRKRQDSTKELENDDLKEAVPKQKKKTKLGVQVMHDSKDTNELTTKQSAKDTVLSKKDEKSSTSQNSGKECLISKYSTAKWVIKVRVKRRISIIHSVKFLSIEVRRLTWA